MLTQLHDSTLDFMARGLILQQMTRDVMLEGGPLGFGCKAAVGVGVE